jgi:predicted secreted hydrolase
MTESRANKGRRLMARWLPLVVLVLAAWYAWWWMQSGDPAPGHDDASTDVVNFLTAGDSGDFRRVEPGVEILFPRDHGEHPEFRQEWWYYTGTLSAKDGRRFGFQLTFFRFAHEAFDEYRDSAWRHEQSWMAHLAISDIAGKRLHAFQDYARGALGLAGAVPDPFAVWLNGWSVRSDSMSETPGLNARLRAHTDEVSIELELAGEDPPLLQGEQGYSTKDHRGETASHYYSMPNLAARGVLRIGDEEFRVEGEAWMDREWSTAVLSREQTGWDWFALRLGQGAVLMVFQVRGEQGDPFRYGIHVDANGRARRFESSEIRIEPRRWWSSRHSGSRYPVSFRVAVETADIELSVDAAFDQQELNLDFRYWEGVVNVTGSVDNVAVRGQGYMELTGY